MPAENKSRKSTKKNKQGQSHAPSSPSSTANDVIGELEALNLEAHESRLLKLPLELRQKIYAFLLDTKHARGSPSPFTYRPRVQDGTLRLQTTSYAYRPRVQDGRLRMQANSPPFRLCTAILRTNKQIHLEAVNTLYSSNQFVRLSLYNDDVYWTQSFLEGTEMGFVCSNPDLVAKLTGHALDVRIIQEKSKILRCQVVFPALFLPRFLEFLQTMCDALPRWGREHAIHLYLRHKYLVEPGATEGLLLEPWRNLHGISNVVVGTGAITPDYANSLRIAMMSRFEPEKWLQSLVKMEEVGTEEFSKGLYQAAVDNCTYLRVPIISAFIVTCCLLARHVRTMLFLILNAHPNVEMLTSKSLTDVNVVAVLESVFRGSHGNTLVAMSPQFHQAVNKLRYQCELNQAFCRLRLENARWGDAFEAKSQWDEAILAADNAIDLAEDNEIHKVWSGCAPRIPGNHKSGYTAVERSEARLCHGSIMMELGYVISASSPSPPLPFRS